MTHKQYYHNKNNKSGSAHTPAQVREVPLRRVLTVRRAVSLTS